MGQGGQGAILRVWDEDLRRHLAMKVILGKVPATDRPGEKADLDAATPPVHPRTVGRFLEEAQVTGQLDHPGIVPVHELGLDHDGRVYFTMKHNGPRSPRRASAAQTHWRTRFRTAASLMPDLSWNP